MGKAGEGKVMSEFNWHQPMSNDNYLSCEELYQAFIERMMDERRIKDDRPVCGHHPDCKMLPSQGRLPCTCSANEY